MKHIIIVICLFMLMVSTSALAHSPGEIDFEFDAKTNLLNISVKHGVSDPADHYVTKIIVLLNDEKIIEQTFKQQESDTIQEVVYKIIDANPGHEITVKAECNKSGIKEKSMKIPLEAKSRKLEQKRE